MSARRSEIIVVGAGFAGLSAATELRRNGVDFVLLEARDRVGGRVESIVNALGERVDTGGQYLCDDMPNVLSLVRQFRKILIESQFDGDAIVQPVVSVIEADAGFSGAMAIRRRMKRLEISDPSMAKLFVADWLALQPEEQGAKAAFQSMMEGLWCQPIDKLPLWYLADNDRRVTNTVPELQYFVAGTMHALSEDIANALGDQVRLGTPATSVHQNADRVAVVTADERWQARHVIIAAPPVAASRIAFAPPLPAPLQVALSGWRSGRVIKALVRYDRAFWRADGRSGTVIWRDVHGLFACDASHDDSRPALVVFIGGPLADQWRVLGNDGVRAMIAERLAAALGPAALDFADMTVRDWCDDRWSGGGYSDSIMDINATGAEAELLKGTPRITFACSELSPSFPGYIEGAIIAGRSAAARAMAALAGS